MQAGPDQGALNAALWADADRVADYSGAVLRPVEVLLLLEHRDALAGRVLDLGCGAGRLTRYLAALSDRVEAFDISARMLAACAAACPSVDLSLGDLRDLTRYPAAAYDVVWASFSDIDVLGHEERLALLGALRDGLAPGGLLVFSSHNLAAADRRRGPLDFHSRRLPARLREARAFPRRVRNHRRVAGLEQRAEGHAVLVDEENEFASVHYYVDRDEQERQLRDRGLTLLACRDLAGAPVGPGDPAGHSSELHYVARADG